MKVAEKYKLRVLILIGISTLVRALVASFIELGNDEVYYVLYARYPDWSHFDHPLMVGLVIQLFSLNLLFESELFIRLSSIIFGAINIWLMFRIGIMVKNHRSGYYAALLYVASIYATVIAGIFVLPDTPQTLFWLISIYLMIKILPADSRNKKAGSLMLLLGFALGLGLLSKYTTVFLWFGMVLFFLFFRRDWLYSPYVYLAALISLIMASPILIWNYQNDWISFVFQGSRVNSFSFDINFTTFITESIGEFIYNNPVNFILVTLTLLAYLRGRLYINIVYLQIILLTTLPLIATFLLVALSRGTLPHWSAPSYTTLLLVAATWLDQWKIQARAKLVIGLSLSILGLLLVVGIAQVRYGIVPIQGMERYEEIGKHDPSLDLFGFDQAGAAFKEIVDHDVQSGIMPMNSILIGNNWFPLANYDFYAARPMGLDSYGIGALDRIHKYAWINNSLGGFRKGMNGYYITDSRYYNPPDENMKSYFESVELADTIQLFRNGAVAKRAFVYRLKNMIVLPPDYLETKHN